MVSVREITQALAGGMMLFGALTLVPKGILMIKLGKYPRGALYVFLGMLLLFFSIVSFSMAFF